MDSVQSHFIGIGANIVRPGPGKSLDNLRSTLESLRSIGYKVNLVHLSISKAETIRRLKKRVGGGGHYVPADIALLHAKQSKETWNIIVDEGNYEQYEEVFNEPGSDGKPTIVRSGVPVNESNQGREGERNSPVDSGSAGRDTGSGLQESGAPSDRHLGNTYSVGDEGFVYPWDREGVDQFTWN